MGAEVRACDNTSVGILARHPPDQILMILRRKYPFGYALPSGHLDGDSYGDACHKEFDEETGLRIVGAPMPMPLIKNSKVNNKCRRGGEYHYWQVFEVEWSGMIMPNSEETRWVGWVDTEKIKKLAYKTEEYLRKYKLASQAEEKSWTVGIRQSLDKEWERCPGLEITWYHILQELKIIP